jgi:hypothetical protein
MFGWLSSIFGRRRSQPVNPGPGQPKRRRLVPDDARFIEAALTSLVSVGLKPVDQDSFLTTAQQIAAHSEGIYFFREPASGDWALIALKAEHGHFKNSMRVNDHCFDVAGPDDYASMIANMVALAGDEWPIESVDVKFGPGTSTPFEAPLIVTIRARPEVAPFQLMHAKDFDWSIIFRLNERLPKGTLGRFAIFLDGDATMVFLTPQQIAELNSLCGHEFFYEEKPEDPLGNPGRP